MSIRSKILAGCLALTLLTGLLGGYTQFAGQRLGDQALRFYDEAFMGVSYLRAAQIGFERAVAGSSQEAAADVLDDLDIAIERAMSVQGRDGVTALRRDFAGLQPLVHSVSPVDAERIRTGFEQAVEIFAADGFRYRRKVDAMVALESRRTNVAIVAALLAAIAITALLSRLIAPPVQRAVRVAQSIAAGRLDNVIEVRGAGETADLLRALETMQSAIACAMRRIEALMAEQARNHAGEIAAQHARMEAALDNMNQGLCLFDAQDRLIVVNRRYADMFGLPALGNSSGEVIAGAGLCHVSRTPGEAAAYACDLADGRAIAVSQRPVEGGGWVATYEDISERRIAEARIAHMARHDALTGLPNRLLLGEYTSQALARMRRDGTVAVLSLDLDRFKAVNETLGHPAGDALLRQVAQRLRSSIREGDFVATLGGDEFAIVQETPRQPYEATTLARRLMGVLGEAFTIAGQEVTLGVSIGIALSSDGLQTSEALLKCADLALNRAKVEGRGNFHFFETEMDTRMQLRRALELDMRRALAEEQFEIFYQPLLRATGGISGFEALLRWRHPQRGMVSPAEFIPLAEEIGLIGQIGGWALRRACTEAASWPALLKVAVNLSPAQFRAGRLADDVAEALAASGLPASLLELEITESVLLQDDEKVLETLHAIRAQGVRIAMDDFGTGYSSLGYLRRFPFDKIKIDQSFVRGMTEQGDCLAIVRAVIGLGRSLGMAVNAEGVESHEQFAMLRNEGCGELQGYLFSRPEPASAIPELLLRHGAAGSPRHHAAERDGRSRESEAMPA